MALIETFIILFLVAVNGFFVAAEFALVSLRPSRLEELIKENRPMASITKSVLNKLNDMLSVCQVGITIASLLLGWLGEKFVAVGLHGLLNLVDFPGKESWNLEGVSITISFIFITFMHITLGELIPKSIAIQSTEVIALNSSLPLLFFYYLFYPITYFMNGITNQFMKTLKLNNLSHKFVHSAEELMILLEEHTKQGNIDNAELQIIQNTFEFSEHEAKEVMTHRLSIVGFSAEEKIKEILPVIAKNHFSRYPVYNKTTDKIIGVIHVQAVIEWLARTNRNKNATVKSIMQAPVFVPETLSIEKVLQKLRKYKQHMAIVVDEYGGVAGLLTVDDIMEEVFGPIHDETDVKVEAIEIKSDSYTIDGEAELDELEDIFNENEIEGMKDVRTIAGFFLEKHQDMPSEGSSITITKGTLTVEKMQGNKILNIRFDMAPLNFVHTKEDYD
ncbi:MAG TPA: hemolysin family protein [Leptospiraceae bacterium]|nr:hemolysin family protein [Leptospiraceae bacterium]HMW05946.1 hemolysin family protein [Leptospiraceae bacterium]HMX35427.1 hemolysin family protein [Leptospiraceae bacterium]HMY32300.1 hemolysin family protein [Leptospiraceae bacterium]HMZ62498.1 hemolysin family protein [Leptospiraceae bacterium]